MAIEIIPWGGLYWNQVDGQINYAWNIPLEDQPILAPDKVDPDNFLGNRYSFVYVGTEMRMLQVYQFDVNYNWGYNPTPYQDTQINGAYSNYVIPKWYKRLPKLFPGNISFMDEYTPQPSITFVNDGAEGNMFKFRVDDCDTKHRPWHQLTIYWSYGPFDFNFTLDKSMTQPGGSNFLSRQSEGYPWGCWIVDTGITIPSPPEGVSYVMHDVSFHPISSFQPPHFEPPTP